MNISLTILDKRFANTWVDTQINLGINRPERAERMRTVGIDRLVSKMREAGSKDCYFFDPTLEHGGPNPNSQRKCFTY